MHWRAPLRLDQRDGADECARHGSATDRKILHGPLGSAHPTGAVGTFSSPMLSRSIRNSSVAMRAAPPSSASVMMRAS